MKYEGNITTAQEKEKATKRLTLWHADKRKGVEKDERSASTEHQLKIEQTDYIKTSSKIFSNQVGPKTFNFNVIKSSSFNYRVVVQCSLLSFFYRFCLFLLCIVGKQIRNIREQNGFFHPIFWS